MVAREEYRQLGDPRQSTGTVAPGRELYWSPTPDDPTVLVRPASHASGVTCPGAAGGRILMLISRADPLAGEPLSPDHFPAAPPPGPRTAIRSSSSIGG